ncbi:hypothetical protein O3P69_007488 [Scylla paramamosain]|uniref:Uncharacterized protein n=1 Tax=Scylla paramamosain TaxID=85552 RepID=A0AAW0V3P8_SCYPA
MIKLPPKSDLAREHPISSCGADWFVVRVGLLDDHVLVRRHDNHVGEAREAREARDGKLVTFLCGAAELNADFP